MAPAMKNGRCRLHGGCSTGPRTAEGLLRSQRSRLKSGDYSRRAKRTHEKLRLLAELVDLLLADSADLLQMNLLVWQIEDLDDAPLYKTIEAKQTPGNGV